MGEGKILFMQQLLTGAAQTVSLIDYFTLLAGKSKLHIILHGVQCLELWQRN
jgi:hypothetical protein